MGPNICKSGAVVGSAAPTLLPAMHEDVEARQSGGDWRLDGVKSGVS